MSWAKGLGVLDYDSAVASDQVAMLAVVGLKFGAAGEICRFARLLLIPAGERRR